MLLYTFCSRTLLDEKLLSSRFCYTLLTTLSTSKGEIIELSVVVAQLANRQFAPKENESLDSISDLTYSMFADV